MFSRDDADRWIGVEAPEDGILKDEPVGGVEVGHDDDDDDDVDVF